MKNLTEDEHLALITISQGYDLERPDAMAVRRFFVWSVGRIFLKFWKAADLIDPNHITDPRGQKFLMNGIRHGETTPDLRAKWVQRAGYYKVEYGLELDHIVAWLWSDTMDGAMWIGDVDAEGRPKKLMKCGDLSRLVVEADRAMVRRQQRERLIVATKELTAKDLRWEADLGCGYSLVRLLSPDALDAESEAMRHCIGHGFYDENLSLPYRYFSVRDENGKPRATIELQDDQSIGEAVILQFRGRRNDDPELHVSDLVNSYAWNAGWISVAERNERVMLLRPAPAATAAYEPDDPQEINDRYIRGLADVVPDEADYAPDAIQWLIDLLPGRRP